MRWGRRNDGRLETPTAKPNVGALAELPSVHSQAADRFLEEWQSILSGLHAELQSAIKDHKTSDIQRLSVACGIASDKVLLFSGRPTEILGGIPNQQARFPAILRQFALMDHQQLPSEPTPLSTPLVITKQGYLVPDPSTLGVGPPKQTERSFSEAPAPHRRRYKGRKDAWPTVPKSVTPENDDPART